MSKKKVFGECRICGDNKQLSEEHYIPRSAGGGTRTKMYGGEELLKTLQKDEEGKTYIPRGKIKQSGLSEYSLCKECNEKSGVLYDKEFARFYNGIHHALLSGISVPEGQTPAEYLEGKVATIELEIKPMNIAKRMLVSFCTIEHDGLAKRQPEIKKAIQDQHYKPDTKDFALYLSLHVGDSAFYGTVAAMKSLGDRFISQVFAGIENDLLAFYYSGDKDTISVGLDKCIDITSWLAKYDYDQTVTVSLELMFNRTFNIRFPIPH